MASVTYKSVSGKGYIFPVTVSEVESWVEINPLFTTTNTGIQSAIEAKKCFTSGKVQKSGNYTTNEKARVTDDVAGGQILTHEIGAAGTGYAVGDIITIEAPGAGKNAVIKVLSVVAVTLAVATYEILEPGTLFTVATHASATTSSTAGANFTLKVNSVSGATIFAVADPFKWTQFASVVNFTQAKEVLRAEPYNVHHMKLKNPEAVMAQAKAHSVEFPNWII